MVVTVGETDCEPFVATGPVPDSSTVSAPSVCQLRVELWPSEIFIGEEVKVRMRPRGFSTVMVTVSFSSWFFAPLAVRR